MAALLMVSATRVGPLPLLLLRSVLLPTSGRAPLEEAW